VMQSEEPDLHIIGHWTYPAGTKKTVYVAATHCDQVELFLNGKSLGRKQRFGEPVELPVGDKISPSHKYLSKFRLMWQVPYAPGELKAVAYQGGKQVAVDTMRTAGAPAKVRLIPDRSKIQADGDDLSFVTVRIEDKDGNLCPAADNLVRFNVTGAGAIAAVDNGNAATVEPFQADRRKAFSGLALLIVRSRQGQPGPVRITAASDGLAQGAAEITTAR